MRVVGAFVVVVLSIGAAAAREVRQEAFEFHRERLFYDNWNVMPPEGWRPKLEGGRLGERLPYDWSERYRNAYNQYFQPNLFYTNAAALCNYSRRNPDQAEPAAALFHELFERMMEFGTYDGDRLYIRSDFEFSPSGNAMTRGWRLIADGLDILGFPIVDDTMPKGWVSAIVNGFAIAGLVKAIDCFDRPTYRSALKGLAAAYATLHRQGQAPPERWISYVDENGYLWFDEYPLPDGRPTRVLNGHIFAVLSLVLYFDKTGAVSVLPLIRGGLTTLKHNLPRFRRPGQVNIYALRMQDYPDYAPARTVRQQCQLFALTGDVHFRDFGLAFRRDIEMSGIEVPDSAARLCRPETD